MFIISLIISFISLGLVVVVHSKNNKTQLMLTASEEEKKTLTTTLANILDENGEIQGQLVLPGHVATSDAIIQLKEVQSDMKTLKIGLEEAKIELENSQKSEREMATTLAEIVDSDGSVLNQIRIPGRYKTPPNKTPCGKLCVNAYWSPSPSDKYWRCEAGEGRKAVVARENFLDAEGQCAMFKTEHEEKIEKMKIKLEVAKLEVKMEEVS